MILIRKCNCSPKLPVDQCIVYCDVVIEYLKLARTNLSKCICRAMVQAVSHRFLTAEARDRSWASPGEVCGGHSGNETCFSLRFCVFPLSVSFHQYFILTFIYTRMRNWRMLGTFQNNAFPEMAEQWKEK
jgi:hypothetical protein